MKSKTLIEKQLRRKNNPELIETLISAKKNKKWLKVAEILSSPTRKRISLNLNEIDGQAKDGEKIVVPGKVLSNGEISKKIKIAALSFSKKAEEKLMGASCKTSTILNEIKSNPSAEGIRILK